MEPSEVRHNQDVEGPDGLGVVWGRTDNQMVVVYLLKPKTVGKRVVRVADYSPKDLKPAVVENGKKVKA